MKWFRRHRWTFGFCIFFLSIFAVIVINVNPTGAQLTPGQLGSWSQVLNWPVYAVHLALMKDGKVLAWDSTVDDTPGLGGTAQTALWDPQTNAISRVENSSLKGHELFCASHAHLPDGNLFGVTGVVGVADAGADLFDYNLKTWKTQPNMSSGRYYPSTTLLANGSLLVTGGAYPTTDGEVPEVFQGGAWRSLTNARIPFGALRGFIDNTSYFPWTQVAPNGNVFYAGPESQMRYINTQGTGSLSNVGERDGNFRDYGSYAMYDTGKLLVVGGGSALKNTYSIDINGGRSVVRAAGSMAFGRRQQNLTILADGQVLVTGGNSNVNARDGQPGSQFDLATAVYAAELWNPATGTWKTLASMAKPRQYHSTALLLPDARVVVAGGVCRPCGAAGHNEKNAEVFSPPYLFNANGTPAVRPIISTAPTSLAYGQSFTINTTQAGTISKAHLIKLGSVTHATNFDQRLVPLTFNQSGSQLSLTAPTNANMATPGHYMLFIVNNAGVPSEAKIIQVGGDPNPIPPAPTVKVPLNQLASIQSLNYPTQYLRHRGFLAYLNPISTAVDKADSTFKVVPGLANSQCVSFESKNFPGYFLRHTGFRTQLNQNNNTLSFRQDATFCPMPGLANVSGVSFRSYNFSAHYLRHRNNEFWVDPYASTSLYKADATFRFTAPQAP